MPRERLCKVCRQWHDLDQPWPAECAAPTPRRTHLAAPQINFDTMNPVQSMTNGQFYDSKSALRSEYRRAGVIEVGNEKLNPKPKTDPAARKKEIRATVGKALSRAGFGA